MLIGERIKARRLQIDMSQDELAKRVGYKSRSSINKIELDGRGLPYPKIVKIAEALQVTPSYLMGWEDENTEIPANDDRDSEIVRMTRRRSQFLITLLSFSRRGQILK